MAQMILLTATQKNGVAYSGTIAVDTSDITVPITAVVGGGSLVTVRKDWDNHHINDNVNVDAWTVSHTLAAIEALSSDLLLVPVIKRKSAVREMVYPTPEDQVFFLPAIIAPVEPDGTGSKFLFHEQGNPLPVQYFTSITPADFVVSPPANITGTLTPSYIPYADTASTLDDSWLRHIPGGISITVDKVIASGVPGQTEISFSATGDAFVVSTDGAGQSEYAMEMYPTALYLYGPFGGLTLQAGSTSLNNDTLLQLNAPIVSFADNALRLDFSSNSPVEIDINATSASKVMEIGSTEATLIDIGRTGANITLHLSSYANDAAAGVGGLTTGMLYLLTATNAVTAKI